MKNDNAKYVLHVVNSKAIKVADIAIDTITVLSGINASGKSTLARMLHEIINLSAIYPTLLKKYAWAPLKTWAAQIVQLNDRIESKDQGLLSAMRMQTAGMEFDKKLEVRDFETTLDELETLTRDVLSRCENEIGKGDIKRAFLAFVRAVGIGDDISLNFGKVLEIFIQKKAKCRETYSQGLSHRSYLAYNYVRDLKYDISWLMDADEVTLSEDGEPVYDVKREVDTRALVPRNNLKELYGLRHSFYIASPWVGIPQAMSDGGVTIGYDDFPHYPVTEHPVDTDDLFRALGGHLEVDESTGRKKWIYKCPEFADPIDLTDCATGMKSLAILNILYKGGFLDGETLLIVDEPEAHLHPQWIFEYARILVLIAKRLKVRMLLTSHHPDMISALKVIAQAEKLGGVRFFLANAESPGKRKNFTYEPLGMNIEPIFRKFNVAIDRIDTYMAQLAMKESNGDFE